MPALSMPLQSVRTQHTATQPAVTAQPVHTQHAATQPTATLARPVYAPSMPMHTMTECTPESAVPVAGCLPAASRPAMPAVYECASTMLMHPTTGAAPTLPTSAMLVHAMHGCTPAMSLHPMPGPATSMTDCTPAVPQPTWPVHEHTPRPTGPALADCTSTVSTCTVSATSAATVHALSQPEPTLSEVKPTASFVVHPSAPPAPVVTQPQVVLIKQFQQPKPYSGSSSWKGYREYFERLAAVNGWSTPEQKVEQLALALEGPATEVLQDLDTSHPQFNSFFLFPQQSLLERKVCSTRSGVERTLDREHVTILFDFHICFFSRFQSRLYYIR